MIRLAHPMACPRRQQESIAERQRHKGEQKVRRPTSKTKTTAGGLCCSLTIVVGRWTTTVCDNDSLMRRVLVSEGVIVFHIVAKNRCSRVPIRIIASIATVVVRLSSHYCW